MAWKNGLKSRVETPHIPSTSVFATLALLNTRYRHSFTLWRPAANETEPLLAATGIW